MEEFVGSSEEITPLRALNARKVYQLENRNIRLDKLTTFSSIRRSNESIANKSSGKTIIQFQINNIMSNVRDIKCPGTSNIKSKRYPAGWEKHSGTIMIWPSSLEFWGEILDGVRKDITNIAQAIAKYEPVDMLVNPHEVENARKALGAKITVIPMKSDDIWGRDMLPIFIQNLDDNSVYGIDLNFNGWGNKQKHVVDGKLSEKVLTHYKFKCVNSCLVGEGGALETDGLGTLLLTESPWINDNRNPGKTRDDVEKQFKHLFGVTKVIWIKGVKDKDITDMHVDAVARFVNPGTVVINKPFKFDENYAHSTILYEQAKEVLKDATDARGVPIKIIEITEPNREIITVGEDQGPHFLTNYVNFFAVNGAIIMPKYGDEKADKDAQDIMQQLYPDRDIVAVSIDWMAQNDGGIHCATREVYGKYAP